MPHRIVLDMDVGVDDALAIMYLAASPEAEIVALGSVHGNIDAEQAARNALLVLEACGLEQVPVAIGARQPLARELVLASHVHGADGLGETNLAPPRGKPSEETAAAMLLRLAHSYPGELDLLAVGPLTNLALALRENPLLLTRFRSTVIMGGAGIEAAPGAPLIGYDANVDHDPEAADIVFAAPGRRVMVGINVTIPTVLAGAELSRIAAAPTRHGQLAWQVLQFYLDVYEQRLGYRGCSVHDPLAAGILLDPTLITASVRGPVELITSERGFRAVVRRAPREAGRPPTEVVTAVDGPRLVASLVAALERPLV
jgi:purine nucleosidase